MTTKYVLWKEEDWDKRSGEMVGKAWVVHSEEDDDEEEAKWMTRTEAKELAESRDCPFDLEGSSMTDEELEQVNRDQGLS
jgi:hypothetical protein